MPTLQARVAGKPPPMSTKKSGQPVSLRAMCEATLNRPLNKSLQTSDWERRPLTRRQLHYAALDAYVSLLIYDVIAGYGVYAPSVPAQAAGGRGDPDVPGCTPRVPIGDLDVPGSPPRVPSGDIDVSGCMPPVSGVGGEPQRVFLTAGEIEKYVVERQAVGLPGKKRSRGAVPAVDSCVSDEGTDVR
jgi:hypothetical protein